MPYTLNFNKNVEIEDREKYINECCVGGDIVLDQLLPALRKQYGELQSEQEDWGWFAWFKQADINLAVDVFTENDKTGSFQILLTSRVPRFLFGHKTRDTPELQELKSLIISQLRSWQVNNLEENTVSENHA